VLPEYYEAGAINQDVPWLKILAIKAPGSEVDWHVRPLPQQAALLEIRLFISLVILGEGIHGIAQWV
jgi:hypothetical protein